MNQTQFRELLDTLVDNHLAHYNEPHMTIGYLVGLASDLYREVGTDFQKKLFANGVQQFADDLQEKQNAV